MNPNRTLLFYLVLLKFCFSSVILRAEIQEQDLGAFKRPAHNEGKSFVEDRAKGVVAEIAKKGSFQEWKTFEDDKIKFSYPDHEAIVVEVKHNEPVPVGGGRVSSVDTSFSRAYRISADGETLLVFMLKSADWLDDGVCFCGAVVYQRYLIRNGNLYRFSFLKNGVLKKMQVLGDGERVMMFEWTHLPLHPAVYRQIARSLEFKKKGPWVENVCQKRVLENYGASGVVGWFDEGSSIESIEKVLGKATQRRIDGVLAWEYPKNENGYRWTEQLSLPFSDNKLLQLDSDFYDSAWDDREAVKGGIPWMLQIAELYKDGSESKEMPENLKETLLSLFIEKAENKDTDFDSLCQVLKVLVEQGVKDERALQIVRKRFASEGGHYAAWVLHEAGNPEDVTLFVEKVRQLFNDAKADPKRDLGYHDLHNWLAFIPNEDSRYADLLRDGLNSLHQDVRVKAYYFIDSEPFSAPECTAFVHAGLKDSSAGVRYWAARYYDSKILTKLDREVLQQALDKEKDEDNLKVLKKVLGKLKSDVQE